MNMKASVATTLREHGSVCDYDSLCKAEALEAMTSDPGKAVMEAPMHTG